MRLHRLFLIAALVLGSTCPVGAVVINEIHYQPASVDGKIHEFIELFNPDPQAVSLAGWRLAEGVEFTFPEGAEIAGGGYAVVCRNRQALETRFQLSGVEVFGNFLGSLDNAGETVLLVDAFNAFVDAVPYRDRLPWPEGAAGKGASLQRLCPGAPSWDPSSWTGLHLPTPLAPNARTLCPPPAPPPPAVVISEIFYHPPVGDGPRAPGDDGEALEFVELHNPGASAIDLGGWQFSEGIEFTFTAGTLIPAGGFLAVCRNQEAVRARFPGSPVLGNYLGKLSNSGERLALLDASGHLVDAVLYGESGDWPYAADGEGRSLEKIAVTGSGYDPANWSTGSLPPGRFQTLTGEGSAGPGVIQRFLLSVNGPGQYVIDNVVLEDVSQPGVNLLPDGAFDAGQDGWTALGNAAASRWHPSAGKDGSGALLLITNGYCPAVDCGTSNGVAADIQGGLNRDGRFRVSMDILYAGGSTEFRGGLYGGAAASTEVLASPGQPNSSSSDPLPPFITRVRRFPEEPRSTDAVAITALVRSEAPAEVTLIYNSGGSDAAVALLDDGLHRDSRAGDGVYGGEIPPFSHNTQVRFRMVAVDSAGRRGEFPRLFNPDLPRRRELWGYYINDLQPASGLPIYHLLLDGVNGNDWQQVNNRLNCQDLRSASFAFKGDLYPDVRARFRGNTACVVKKRNFKVVFNRGRYFRGVKKINLNSQWTDKSLVREHLAWEFFRDLGAPYMQTEYVRLHVSGSYYGLYLYLEHPDSRFLERNGLDPDGNLYKSKQPPRLDKVPVGVARHVERDYPLFWEEETNPGGDFSDIAGFVGAMHDDGRKPEGPSVDFWQSRSVEEMIIAYQIGQVVLNNIDSFAKNHFLYHDLRSDRWGFITWDMDLTFGKFFAPEAIGFGREVGTLNDIMMCNPPPVTFPIPTPLDPWFTTTVLDFQPYNWLIDFFFRAGRDHYHRAYLTRLWDLLEEKFRADLYGDRLAALARFLAAEQAEDFNRWERYPTNVPGFPEDMLRNLEIVKDQIACHREFLRDFITSWDPGIPDHPKVKFTEILYNPEAADQALEFIELQNVSGRPVDVSGWSIEEGIQFVFPPESVLPAGEFAIVARTPAGFRARYGDREVPHLFGPYLGRLANEGDTLRLRDAGPGYPATIDYVRYEGEGQWPELLPGQSLELSGAARDLDGNNPENWKASAVLGGTPGRAKLPFSRGDANGDGGLDVSDPIFLLTALFLGGPQPPCDDAADADNDGEESLTDAIFVLRFLYLQGPEPPPPFPGCGLEPGEDDLSCKEYAACTKN